MKYFKLVSIILVGALFLLGCQDPSLPSPALSSTVRSATVVFINAAPDGAASQSFLVDNASAASVNFPGGSALTPINASIEQFRIKNAVYGIIKPDTISQKADLISQTSATAIQGSGHYTVVLTDSVNRPFGKTTATPYTKDPGGLTFTTITDAITAPASGNAGIRFFNLAPGAASVYLTHDGGSTFTGLTSSAAYKKTSGSFTSIATGTYTLEVRTGSITGTIAASLPSTVLTDGKLYTIFLSGKVVKIGGNSVVKVPYAVSIVGHN